MNSRFVNSKFYCINYCSTYVHLTTSSIYLICPFRGKGLRRKWSTQIYNTDTGVWRLGPTVPSRFDYSRLTTYM